MTDRLFGVPGAENLHDDIAAAYEVQIEPWVDDHDRRPRVIEEFTVHPPEYHVPPASHIVEWLVERIAEDGEVDEGYYEHLQRTVEKHPDVLAATEVLRATLAALVTYRMADKRVAQHAITWDDAGEPLVNGEPMYVRSTAS